MARYPTGNHRPVSDDTRAVLSQRVTPTQGNIKTHRTAVLNKIPDASVQGFKPFDYIVVTTKNVADIPPTVAELIAPAVTPAHTVITLLQNGLNIEKPVMAKFPKNIVLSGVTFCGSHEHGHGDILHEYEDESYIGAFRNPNLNTEDEDKAAKEYVALYAASGKNVCEWKPDVGFTRWRKLMYNACLNPICAITDLDTGRIQLADGAADDLVKPAMNEIRAAAKACGHDLPEDLVNFMITMDPITMYNPPSMQGDVRKVRRAALSSRITIIRSLTSFPQ